jgi:hypothetical protein
VDETAGDDDDSDDLTVDEDDFYADAFRGHRMSRAL